MSDNGVERIAEPPPPEQQVATIDCQNPACGAKVQAKVPLLRVINDRNMSIAIATHEVEAICSKCGVGMVPVINKIDNIEWKFVPVPPRKDIVIAKPGLIV